MQRRGAITELCEFRQRDQSPDVRSCPSIPRRLGQHLTTLELLTLGSSLDGASYKPREIHGKLKQWPCFKKNVSSWFLFLWEHLGRGADHIASNLHFKYLNLTAGPEPERRCRPPAGIGSSSGLPPDRRHRPPTVSVIEAVPNSSAGRPRRPEATDAAAGPGRRRVTGPTSE